MRRADHTPEPCPWEETSGPVADVAARGARAGDTAGGSARSGSHAAERDASGAGARRAGASGDAEAPKQPQEEAGAAPFRVFTGDRVLWIIVAALAVISILVVYSSTAKMG